MRRLILLVEDDAVLRTPLRRALEAHGYEVRVAATAEEGLALVGAVELVRRTRAARPDVPIVIITGAPEGAIAHAGAHDVVLKPFEPERLLAAVERALEGRPGTDGRASRPAARPGARAHAI